ncbi:hypothetical protein [Noviherbaspirillum aerium]|nr:hypothetical protein [Noviherbaspirillum aerium]
MTTTTEAPGTIATRVFDVLVGHGQTTVWKISAMSAKVIAEATH